MVYNFIAHCCSYRVTYFTHIQNKLLNKQLSYQWFRMSFGITTINAIPKGDIDGSVQDCSISIGNTLGLRQFRMNPLI